METGNTDATDSIGGRWLALGWPAFLAASLLELAVFALVDPYDLQWAGQPLGWSRLGVYSTGFFLFWAVSALGCALTATLLRPRAGERDAAVE